MTVDLKQPDTDTTAACSRTNTRIMKLTNPTIRISRCRSPLTKLALAYRNPAPMNPKSAYATKAVSEILV